MIKQIPKRPRLRPVCEFPTANHRDGAANNCLSSSIANLASGKADDLLSSVVLASDCPILIAHWRVQLKSHPPIWLIQYAP
jgi:hypothetical protein